MQEVCEKAVKPEKASKAVSGNKKHVQFLTKWLTDLVPQEPAYALKVTMAG